MNLLRLASSLILACMLCLSAARAAEQPADKPAGKPAEASAASPALPATPDLPTDIDRVSYVLGIQFAAQISQSLKPSGVDLNVEAYLRGFKEAYAGKPSLFTAEQAQKVLADYQEVITQKRQEKAQENLGKAQAFLEKNKNEAGVKTTASGLQYRVLKEGEGKSPGPNDRVKVNYRGTLLDGTEFDSSYKRGEPSVFSLTGIIPGWTEAMQMMKEGAKWQLFIPPDLAYGERARPTIPGHSLLIFEVELLEVVPSPPQAAMPFLPSAPAQPASAPQPAGGAKAAPAKPADQPKPADK